MRLDPYVNAELRCETFLLGSTYGGWSVWPELLDAGSTVLSAGIGTDISFDLALIERFGCRVHAYDPTPRSLAWLSAQRLPDRFVAHPVGLAGEDGAIKVSAPANTDHASFHINHSGAGDEDMLTVPVLRLGRLLAELGAAGCDLLKMDIEGAEYGVCRDIVEHGPRPRQLLVEFHHRLYGFTVAMTEEAVASLRGIGYRVFWVSATGREYGLALA